jgi:adenine/guanine phosphoribosyltransferase-like PRPP-binding protein
VQESDLLDLDPRDYDNRILTVEDILPWFSAVNAFWQYEGEPSLDKPHAELTSGLCSGGYFDVPRVLRYPNIAEILGRQLAWRLQDSVSLGRVDWVVSSAYAAIVFGHEVAKELRAIFLNTRKDPSDPKKQLWQEQTIPAGSRVLQIEELITTTQTLEEVRRVVTESNTGKPVNFLPVAGTLVLRPEKLLPEYAGKGIIGFIEREIKNYKPEECPYCAVGSPRYRPRTHWTELTGKK